MATKAPKREIGAVVTAGIIPWGSFIEDTERVPELQWPHSIEAYDVMRTDSQVEALLNGTFLPILNYRWQLNPNGAKAKIVTAVARDLSLPVVGKEQKNKPRRGQFRFSFKDHLRHALLATVFGHMFFEQVGAIDAGMWRLRKLAPRMPASINEIVIEEDGGLRSIKQQRGVKEVEIPVTQLVAYVWNKEGGNWYGRSMLRSLYKHWLIKDRLLRIDAMKHERNGLGVPVIRGPKGVSRRDRLAYASMAQQFKAGEAAGGYLPDDVTLELVGVSGSLPDTIGSVRYHDEAMARAFMMMLLQLGQTETGSRALGQTFESRLDLSLRSIASWLCDVFNEHVIEDYVDWNWGEDENAPLLEFEVDDTPGYTADEIVALIGAGALTVDSELEAYIRGEGALPEAKPLTFGGSEVGANGQPRSPVTASQPPDKEVPGGRSGSGRLRAVGPLPLPDRPLRREPFEHEIVAQVNFRGIDDQFTSLLDQAIERWQEYREEQIEQITAQIVEAHGNLARLSILDIEPVGADVLEELMDTMLEEGALHARDEASRQGREAPDVDLQEAFERVTARADAVAEHLARSMSDAAARQALQHTAPGVDPEDVANRVREHLESLSDAFLREQLGGALNAAMNEGRREVMASAGDATFYASELLDESTCENCANVDGKEYDSLAATISDYPTGGYRACKGGARCRGTVIAVYEGEGVAAARPPFRETDVVRDRRKGREGQFAEEPDLPDPSLPPRAEWVPPTPLRGKASPRKAGGYTASGITNTRLGDIVEKAVVEGPFGFRSLLEGKRQGPFDVGFTTEDGTEWGFEVKAVMDLASEYKAKPDAEEVARKLAAAKELGINPALIIAVVNSETGNVQLYWRPGIGSWRLSKKFTYIGDVSVNLEAA